MSSSLLLPGFHNMTALREKLRACIRSISPDQGSAIVQCSIEIEPCDLFEWLEAQPYKQKLYWSHPDGNFSTAGVGAAEILSGTTADDLQHILRTIAQRTHNSSALYCGGARFSFIASPDEHWKPFHGCMFVLPRVQISTHGHGTILTLNAVVSDGRDPADELYEAVESLAPPAEGPPLGVPPVLERTDTPDRRGWGHNIAAALESFASGETEKIVLARRASLLLRESVSPWTLTRLLYTSVARAFVFCFQPEEGAVFLGATPERLYCRESDRVITGVVAGTRPRGTTDSEDKQRREELLGSPKDRHEHEIVRRHIVDVLERFGTISTTQQIPELIALPRLLHLYTPIESMFDMQYTDADLLPELHPTPAVGGMPREISIRAIASLEGFDRGWYAGPFGVIGNSKAEFAVAIRSGLLEGNRLHLFSGAGIVPGSDAQAEWEEIELKLGNFLALLEPVQKFMEQELDTDDTDLTAIRG